MQPYEDYIDSLIGVPLGNYRIDKLIGRGGMARVYRAVDLKNKDYVAIKVIDNPFLQDDEFRKRFRLEWEAIAKLDHPNIISPIELGRHEDSEYIVMQYVDGADMDKVMLKYKKDQKYMRLKAIQRVTNQIAYALDHMHGKGIIHRDIKPENIIIDRKGQAFISDFGLVLHQSKGTTGLMLGSPHYVAPEQVESSAKAVPQSDIYGLGVMLFEMFTNTVPFTGDSEWGIALKHVEEDTPLPTSRRPELSLKIERIIVKAMEKDIEKRYQKASDLSNDLLAI